MWRWQWQQESWQRWRGQWLAACIGLLFLPYLLAASGDTPSTPDKVAGQEEHRAVPAGWTQIVKSAMPAVVNISSTRVVRVPHGEQLSPYFADPFFRFFKNPERIPRRERSLGSGVIVASGGIVLTNYHVIEGASDIRVTVSDGRELAAEVVGTDPKTDLAVLRLPGDSFPVLSLGDSDKVQIAETVLAIGNPFGLSQTVTMGIVSAIGRANLGIADYEDFIQTDTAINPGNSGGALINTQGELIGINTAIISPDGGYMGIGFAVPSNMARGVMEHILNTGKVQRGWMGIVMQELTPALARGLGLPNERGLLVADVVEGGPAYRSGLQRGDVVTQFGERTVLDVGHFRNLIAETPPGEQVIMVARREKEEKRFEVTIGALPETETPPESKELELEELGLVVTDLTPDLARRIGIPVYVRGAIVLDVFSGSASHEAGLQPGDVIQEMNRQPVHIARDIKRNMEQAVNQSLVLLINREGTLTYLVIERLS